MNLAFQTGLTTWLPRYCSATRGYDFTQAAVSYTHLGIGRPSTYAPTITTILSHEYVVKEGKYLRPTSLGEVVTGLMEERFPDIVDLKFTARMEDGLDDIEKGEKSWKEYLSDFYGGFETELKLSLIHI